MAKNNFALNKGIFFLFGKGVQYVKHIKLNLILYNHSK